MAGTSRSENRSWMLGVFGLLLVTGAAVLLYRSGMGDSGESNLDTSADPNTTINEGPRRSGLSPGVIPSDSLSALSPASNSANATQVVGLSPRFELHLEPTSADARELVPSEVRFTRVAGKDATSDKADAVEVSFEVFSEKKITGELPLAGDYVGELHFKNTTYRKRFELWGVGVRSDPLKQPIRYGWCKSVKWPYLSVHTIEEAVIRSTTDEDEKGTPLNVDADFLSLDQSVSLPKFLTVTVRDGRTWRRRISSDIDLLRIDFGDTISVFATDLKTGMPLQSVRSCYRYKNADITAPALENGECFVPPNAPFSVRAPGCVPSFAHSKGISAHAEPPSVPLIHRDSCALRFVDAKGRPLAGMRVLYGWAEHGEATDPSGFDARLRGETNAEGLVRWDVTSKLHLNTIESDVEAAERAVSLYLRDSDWGNIWQSEEPLTLRALVAARDLRIDVAPRLYLRLRRNGVMVGEDVTVRGRGLIDGPSDGRSLLLSGKKTGEPDLYDLGRVATDAIEVTVRASHYAPQRQTFTDLENRTIEMTLRPVEKLRMYVSDDKGRGVQGVELHVNDLEDATIGSSSVTVTTDNEGHAEVFVPVSAGFLIHGFPRNRPRFELWPPQVVVEDARGAMVEFAAREKRRVDVTAVGAQGEDLGAPLLTNPFFADNALGSFHARRLNRFLIGTTYNAGEFQLPEGISIETIAVAPRARPTPTTIFLKPGQEKLTVELPLGPSLEGRLLNSDAGPRKGIKVHLVPTRLDGFSSLPAGVMDRWCEAVRSDDDGRFRFNALTPGSYRLQFEGTTSGAWSDAEVTVRKDLVMEDRVLPD